MKTKSFSNDESKQPKQTPLESAANTEKFSIRRFNPCNDGLTYYKSKSSFEEAWNDCPRGDWMLWIAFKLGVDDRTLTKAKALCANTVRHLMKDKRNTDALDAALRYAEGKISRKELEEYAGVSYVAVDNVDTYDTCALVCSVINTDTPSVASAATAADVAYAAATETAYAPYAAVARAIQAADPIAYAAGFAAAYAAAVDAYADAAVIANAAKEANQLATANVCRAILTKAVFEKVKTIQAKQFK
jgi:hypothetical protein